MRPVTSPDRLPFSTDYPFQQPTQNEITAFLNAFPLEAARDAFAFGTARRLFHFHEGP